ncbi:unnamed protein product [marine sediment metagenome]|uniref:MPN domain-containing protein n=1 Tax=marine sediment metagenome TaxID=412755 RepID=X0SN58_9ZZZZ
MDKILKVKNLEYQKHDETNLRCIRRVETTLVEDHSFEYFGEPITDSAKLAKICESVGRKDREIAVILFLDKLSYPIGYDIFMGGIDFVTIDPRQVFKVAAMLNASKIAVCHNHPEGDPHPSRDDQTFCLQLSNLCFVMGWQVLDFIILASGAYYSFRDSKNPSLLDKFPTDKIK